MKFLAFTMLGLGLLFSCGSDDDGGNAGAPPPVTNQPPAAAPSPGTNVDVQVNSLRQLTDLLQRTPMNQRTKVGDIFYFNEGEEFGIMGQTQYTVKAVDADQIVLTKSIGGDVTIKKADIIASLTSIPTAVLDQFDAQDIQMRNHFRPMVLCLIPGQQNLGLNGQPPANIRPIRLIGYEVAKQVQVFDGYRMFDFLDVNVNRQGFFRQIIVPSLPGTWVAFQNYSTGDAVDLDMTSLLTEIDVAHFQGGQYLLQESFDGNCQTQMPQI